MVVVLHATIVWYVFLAIESMRKILWSDNSRGAYWLRRISSLINKTRSLEITHRNALLCRWKSDLYRNRDFWHWVFKVFKRSRKPTAEESTTETRVENVQFLSWRVFFVGKYGIQSTNEMAFKRTVTLREFSISPPSDLVRPRYCRSADARMRTQNALLLDKAPDKAQ